MVGISCTHTVVTDVVLVADWREQVLEEEWQISRNAAAVLHHRAAGRLSGRVDFRLTTSSGKRSQDNTTYHLKNAQADHVDESM